MTGAVLAIALIALLISFTCSLFEAALYAITPSQLEVLRQKGRFAAARMAWLRANIDQPIAAILTINTVSHTAGSAMCGGLVAEHSGNTAAGVFAGVFTLVVLVFSEILPKSLGVRYAAAVAPWMVWPLQVMIWVSWPIARATRGLMHVLAKEPAASAPTADEILVLTRLARQRGNLRPQELRWVENALQLEAVTARDLMTPRTVVESLPADLSTADLRQSDCAWVHTRLPLVEGDDPDGVVGYVHGKDLLRSLIAGKSEPLRRLAQPIDFVPESMNGHDLLDKFIHERVHIVAVADEYGGFEGIVTLEDVLESLLGAEILDEHDEHADMQVVARRRAAERAREIQALAQAQAQARRVD